MSNRYSEGKKAICQLLFLNFSHSAACKKGRVYELKGSFDSIFEIFGLFLKI